MKKPEKLNSNDPEQGTIKILQKKNKVLEDEINDWKQGADMWKQAADLYMEKYNKMWDKNKALMELLDFAYQIMDESEGMLIEEWLKRYKEIKDG